MGSKNKPPAPPRPPKKRKPANEALDDIPTVSVDGILPPASVRELDLSDVELVDGLDELADEVWSAPPTELDDFLDDGGDEAPLPLSQPAPADPQAGPGPLQEPPAPDAEGDHQDGGPTSAARSHAGDSDPPSSLRQLFSKISPDSQPWWSDDDALARAPGAIPAPPPQADGGEATRALLRASGRPAAPAAGDEVEIDLAPPAALPDLAAPDAKERAGRSAASSVSPSERSQPRKRPPDERRSRTAIYVAVFAGVVIGAALWIRQKPGADSTIPGGDTTHPDSASSHQASPGAGGAAAPNSEPTSTLSMGPSTAWVLGPGHVPTLDGQDAGATDEPADAGGPVDTSALGQDGAGSDGAAPTASASAESDTPPFDRAAAGSALQQAAGIAALCPRVDSAGTRRVTVAVTFAPSGRVTTALVAGGPYAGTPTGSCIARAFRSARVPPFTGSFVTVQKTLQLQ